MAQVHSLPSPASQASSQLNAVAAFAPFANDTQVLSLVAGDEELSIENGTDAVRISGTLLINPHDARSLRQAAILMAALEKIVVRTACPPGSTQPPQQPGGPGTKS